MSTINAYSLHDMKALTYSAPFYQPTDGAACRVLQEVLNDPNNNIARYPADFRCFRVGSFNTDQGVFQALTTPEFVCDLLSLLSGGPTPADNS